MLLSFAYLLNNNIIIFNLGFGGRAQIFELLPLQKIVFVFLAIKKIILLLSLIILQVEM